MRELKKLLLAAFVLCFAIPAYSDSNPDSLGLPGDNLDLYGVLELFKKSESLEDFEKALNSEDNHINNLDLNGDEEIDYIRVIDHTENSAHAIVLQVPINETESQDVAVIEVERKGDEIAHVQIIGDEDLYGKDYIIEPSEEVFGPEKSASTVVVNVWAWPAVRYIYGPKYVVWVSPWRWRYYPVWWKPWKPVGWHIHHNHVKHYHVHYRPVIVYRSPYAHKVYYGHRVASSVYKKSHPVKVYKKAPPKNSKKVPKAVVKKRK